jgi:hypothetical protein
VTIDDFPGDSQVGAVCGHWIGRPFAEYLRREMIRALKNSGNLVKL